jgi:hypothetical protein
MIPLALVVIDQGRFVPLPHHSVCPPSHIILFVPVMPQKTYAGSRRIVISVDQGATLLATKD